MLAIFCVKIVVLESVASFQLGNLVSMNNQDGAVESEVAFGALGVKLSDAQLEKTKTIPLKPQDVVLEGSMVRLEPLSLQRDNAFLHQISCGEAFKIAGIEQSVYDADSLIWRYMTAGPFETSCKLAAFLKAQVDAANGLCLRVFSKSLDAPVGVVNYMNNIPEHLKIELGSIWYSPLVQGRGVNLEATYLLLKHAFALGYRRVEWKCDSLNVRSRRSALSMGFKFEGIQESHFIIKGRNRDTAWFRILDSEWPNVCEMLEAKLAR